MEPVQKKKDRSTIILLLVALGLLGLVILFFQRELLFSLFGQAGKEAGVRKQRMNPPRIERISDLEEPVLDEPLVEEDATVPLAEPSSTPLTDNTTGTQIRTPVYFITVTDDGAIHLKSVIRSVENAEGGVRQALEILLSGPETGEINKGLFSMIPQNSRLLSMEIRGTTVWCNFNEDFQFNDLGREGYIAQLAQIVYTLTEFDGIENVQILIDGKKRDYLGADGIAIQEPLSRAHF